MVTEYRVKMKEMGVQFDPTGGGTGREAEPDQATAGAADGKEESGGGGEGREYVSESCFLIWPHNLGANLVPYYQSNTDAGSCEPRMGQRRRLQGDRQK